MKCSECGQDSKKKERLSGKCHHCGAKFAFEPMRGDTMTDVTFQHAIDLVSGGGKLKWLKENLYYEICRRKIGAASKKARLCAIVCLVVGIIFLVIGFREHFAAFWLFSGGFFLFIALISYIICQTRSDTVLVTMGDFEKLWHQWTKAHGVPNGSIERRKNVGEKRRVKESDLTDYSFDRAVICDRFETVNLLLANNFHFENNCAILSFDGYPKEIFEVVRTMLKRNPKLHVFALHDATPEGCRMPTRLATLPEWFKGNARVTDVGLCPAQYKPFRGLLQKSTAGTITKGEGISAAEAKWLSEYSLELAAIRPEQILKRMFKAINRKIDTETSVDGTFGSTTDGGGAYESDPSSFGSDAGDSDAGGGDGFG